MVIQKENTLDRRRRVTGSSKVILWQNIVALMRHKYGRENINQLARDAKISPGTVSRIKKIENSTGLDVIERIAGVFRLQAWQLLLPGLDPSNVPMTMITETERQLYEKLKRVYALLKGEVQ